MYFNFEDYRPETPTVEGAMSRREAFLLSVAMHVALVVLIIEVPRLPVMQRMAADRARQLQLQRQEWLEQQRQAGRFVFVQPRVDLEAPQPPREGEASDKNRLAAAVERALSPKNRLPFSRGNTPERVESEVPERARGDAKSEEGGRGESEAAEATDARRAIDRQPLPFFRPLDEGQRGVGGGAAQGRGALGEALRNLDRYVGAQNFENPQGGGGQFGPWIQFDTKGVEFGPWIRRFVAQIKRNWFIPYAAMSLKGHVVITFNVHKDGAISELRVVDPSTVEAFTNAAFNALLWSNPTQPLPPEYPADHAFFTVTFYYNEMPAAP